MKRGIISIGVWAVLALAASAGAQGVASSGPSASGPSASPAMLLEKGIYTEQTVGDLDAAIGIYQRIVNDTQANRPYVAQAHYRLGLCLLKKGQKDQALAAFQVVASRFSDQKDLAAQAAKQIDALRPAGAGLTRTRHFVLVVASPDGLTLDGAKTTWDDLPALLEKVPDRANTVLEAAVASADVSIQFKNEAMGKLTALARQLGFEYFSETGIKSLGSKGDASQQVAVATPRLPWEVMAYIVQSSMESYFEAKQTGVNVNVHIHGVDNQLNKISGGLLAAVNGKSEPDAGPIHLGNFGTDKPGFELMDEQGNPQEYEVRENPEQRIGKWGVWWKPAQPVAPGALRILGYISKKPMPLQARDGKAKLTMSNHFGGPVLESFFLVVPEGMTLENPSTPPTAKKTLAGLDIYLWRESVPVNTTHRVNVVLKASGQAATREASSAASEVGSPRIVKTVPAAFATEVDPSLDKITVTFDRPMMDGSWSWTGGGDMYPQTTGRPSYDSTRTTCTLPVKLQPGKVYGIGINSPSHQNFRSADGKPAQRYVIVFATRSADGKPTPLPEKLVKESTEINAGVHATIADAAGGAAPAIVKTIPAAFATDVNPTLDKISVAFNRPMRDGAWSWTGGGDTYPQTTDRPSYDAARTICSMPVKLEPGKVYWVGINSPSHRNFKSADGVPAKWYIILFATRSADGKPTPLPEDMVKKANGINAAAAMAAQAAASAGGDEALKGKLVSWVEKFFGENFRDITARKTLEWGEVERTAGGNLAIRYKYLATIWNKDQMVNNQRFTFTPEGKYVSAETIEKGPATQPAAADEK